MQSLHQYALTTHEGGGGGVFSLIFVTYVFVCATEGRAFDDFFGNYFYWLPGEIPPCQPNQYPHHEGEGGAVPKEALIIPQTDERLSQVTSGNQTRRQKVLLKKIKNRKYEHLYICRGRELKVGVVFRNLWSSAQAPRYRVMNK